MIKSYTHNTYWGSVYSWYTYLHELHHLWELDIHAGETGVFAFNEVPFSQSIPTVNLMAAMNSLLLWTDFTTEHVMTQTADDPLYNRMDVRYTFNTDFPAMTISTPDWAHHHPPHVVTKYSWWAFKDWFNAHVSPGTSFAVVLPEGETDKSWVSDLWGLLDPAVHYDHALLEENYLPEGDAFVYCVTTKTALDLQDPPSEPTEHPPSFTPTPQDTDTDMEPITLDKDLPQKAMALERLADISESYIPGKRLPHAVFTTFDRFNSGRVPKGYKWYFVRPCPYVPNHGAAVAGWESHKVPKHHLADRCEEILADFDEEAPKAALLVMPYVSARFSAVAAPDEYVSIGRGHDGVTAGTDAICTLPLRPTSTYFITEAGEDPGEVEVELVYGHTDAHGSDRTYLVQLRRAPEHVTLGAPPCEDAVRGFVPPGRARVQATYVVDDITDVNELEDIDTLLDAQDLAPEELLVIQESGSMLSHAGAHCRAKGIPFIIDAPSRWARVTGETVTLNDASGWVVEGEIDEDLSYDPYLYRMAFADGLEIARRSWKRKDVQFSVFFHQYTTAPMNDPADSARYAGVFVGWLAMAGLMACVGELRHALGQMYHCGNTKRARLTRFMRGLLRDSSFDWSHSRDTVYDRIQGVAPTWYGVAEAVEQVGIWFDTESWSSGYGGDKWGAAAYMAEELARLIAIGPDQWSRDQFNRIIEQANRMENVAHNNGWLFNKFADKSWLDIGTEGASLDTHHIFWLADSVASLDERIPHRPAPPVPWDEVVIEALNATPESVATSSPTSDDTDPSPTETAPPVYDGVALLVNYEHGDVDADLETTVQL